MSIYPHTEEQIYLECINNNSSKFYRISLIETSESVFSASAEWGKIGQSGQTQLKIDSGTKFCALYEINKLVAAKEAKGYVLKEKLHTPKEKKSKVKPLASPLPKKEVPIETKEPKKKDLADNRFSDLDL